MSEVTYICCDGMGCGEKIPRDEFETVGGEWIKDEFDADLCPFCQQAAEDLEASAADGKDLTVFGETLSKTADAILESPEVVKMKAERLAAYEKIKKDTLKAIRKDMKAQGLSDVDIAEVLDETERELDETYNQKFNFKAEA